MKNVEKNSKTKQETSKKREINEKLLEISIMDNNETIEKKTLQHTNKYNTMCMIMTFQFLNKKKVRK